MLSYYYCGVVLCVECVVWNERRGGRSGKKGWKGRQGGIVG